MGVVGTVYGNDIHHQGHWPNATFQRIEQLSVPDVDFPANWSLATCHCWVTTAGHACNDRFCSDACRHYTMPHAWDLLGLLSNFAGMPFLS